MRVLIRLVLNFFAHDLELDRTGLLAAGVAASVAAIIADIFFPDTQTQWDSMRKCFHTEIGRWSARLLHGVEKRDRYFIGTRRIDNMERVHWYSWSPEVHQLKKLERNIWGRMSASLYLVTVKAPHNWETPTWKRSSRNGPDGCRTRPTTGVF